MRGSGGHACGAPGRASSGDREIELPRSIAGPDRERVQIARIGTWRSPCSAAESLAARAHQRRADLPRAMHRAARGQPINPTDNLSLVLRPSPDNPGDRDGRSHLRGGLPGPLGAARSPDRA